jgi:exodeoxyribonuclease VII small subunit
MPETPEIPYEQARDELIEIVQKLETGGTSLEEALALWERGEKLAGICQQWLDGAKERLAKASGTAQTDQDADSEEM